MSIESMSDEGLRDALLMVKTSFMRFVDACIADPSYVPLAQIGTTMQLPIMGHMETELKKRGYDVTNQIFGPDILGEAILIMKEE